MNNKLSPIVLFLIVLTLALAVIFFTHSEFLNFHGHSNEDNLLVLAYLVNALLAASIYIILYLFRTELKDYIGFLFMGGSLLKFVVFYLLFYPVYHADGDINTLEFTSFFVPYFVCLIIETIFMVKLVKKSW